MVVGWSLSNPDGNRENESKKMDVTTSERGPFDAPGALDLAAASPDVQKAEQRTRAVDLGALAKRERRAGKVSKPVPGTHTTTPLSATT